MLAGLTWASAADGALVEVAGDVPGWPHALRRRTPAPALCPSPNRRTPVDTTENALNRPATFCVSRAMQLMGRAYQKYGETVMRRSSGLWQGGSWRRAWCSPPAGIATAEPLHRAAPTRRSGSWRRPATTCTSTEWAAPRSISASSPACGIRRTSPGRSGWTTAARAKTGTAIRDHRGTQDDHRLTQLRRLTVFSTPADPTQIQEEGRPSRASLFLLSLRQPCLRRRRMRRTSAAAR